MMMIISLIWMLIKRFSNCATGFPSEWWICIRKRGLFIYGVCTIYRSTSIWLGSKTSTCSWVALILLTMIWCWTPVCFFDHMVDTGYLTRCYLCKVIALSATELGGLIGLTTSESVEFFHDPHMGTRFVIFMIRPSYTRTQWTNKMHIHTVYICPNKCMWLSL